MSTKGETSEVRVNVQSPNKHSKGNKYATFNKEERLRVIFWIGITIFIVGVTCCVASFTVPYLKKTSMNGVEMWQWSLLITALLGGPVLSKATSNFILFCIERDFSAKENSIYYVAGLVESAWVVLWFGMILLAWVWVVDEPSYLGVPKHKEDLISRKFEKTEHIITFTLITLLLGSFLWLVKDLCVMIMKSSFHVRRFFDRIRDSLTHEYRIRALSVERKDGEQPSIMPRKLIFCKGEKNVCGCAKKEREVDLSCLEDVDHETVSCWTMKILTQEILKERSLVYMVGDEEVEIDSEEDAIKAGEKIFLNFGGTLNYEKTISSKLDKKNIENQLRSYVGEKEAHDVIQWWLVGADAKHVDVEDFRKSVISAWKFRSALVRALQTNKRLFRQLNIFVDAALVIIIFVLWLVFLNAAVRKVMVLLGSFIVGSAFVFGDFCKKLLNDFTFVFVTHPFDVGDCCLIEGTPMIIEKIYLLTTKISTLDHEMKFYPNSVLCNLIISNYTRSPRRMGDYVVFFLPISTDKHQISELEEKIKSHIEKNHHHWRPEHELVVEFDSGNPTKLRATLRVKHTTNYHDYQEIQARKSELVLQLQEILKESKLIEGPNQTDPS